MTILQRGAVPANISVELRVDDVNYQLFVTKFDVTIQPSNDPALYCPQCERPWFFSRCQDLPWHRHWVTCQPCSLHGGGYIFTRHPEYLDFAPTSLLVREIMIGHDA